MSSIEVARNMGYDPKVKKYVSLVYSDNPLEKGTNLVTKLFNKISIQLRGFYFLLIEELFLFNKDKRFDLVHPRYHDFFMDMSKVYIKYKDDNIVDYQNFQQDLLKGFRYSINTSLGKPASIKDMDRNDLLETIDLIIEKASSVGINLEEFLDENKPLSLKKEYRKQRKMKL